MSSVGSSVAAASIPPQKPEAWARLPGHPRWWPPLVSLPLAWACRRQPAEQVRARCDRTSHFASTGMGAVTGRSTSFAFQLLARPRRRAHWWPRGQPRCSEASTRLDVRFDVRLALGFENIARRRLTREVVEQTLGLLLDLPLPNFSRGDHLARELSRRLR